MKCRTCDAAGNFGRAGYCAGCRLRRRSCVDCGWRMVTRPAQRCRPCYQIHIGATAVPRPEYSRSGTTIPVPTRAWPGTLEKIAVLTARVAAGEMLWHPQDAGQSEAESRLAGILDGLVEK